MKRKTRQRETFRFVPRERLLIETDAPDQLLPDDCNRFPLIDPATGKLAASSAKVSATISWPTKTIGHVHQ